MWVWMPTGADDAPCRLRKLAWGSLSSSWFSLVFRMVCARIPLISDCTQMPGMGMRGSNGALNGGRPIRFGPTGA